VLASVAVKIGEELPTGANRAYFQSWPKRLVWSPQSRPELREDPRSKGKRKGTDAILFGTMASAKTVSSQRQIA